MKILFAIKSLKNYGGAERVFVDVVNKLHALGYDITVLTFDKSLRNSAYKLNQRYQMLQKPYPAEQAAYKYRDTAR